MTDSVRAIIQVRNESSNDEATPARLGTRTGSGYERVCSMGGRGVNSIVSQASRRDHKAMTAQDDTVTLWRPTGPEELALVEASGWCEWPPRLPG